MEQFLQALSERNLIDQGGNIILEHYDNGCQVVEQEIFTEFFGDIFNDSQIEDKYAALLAADKNPDGSFKGYAKFFEAWHNSGII